MIFPCACRPWRGVFCLRHRVELEAELRLGQTTEMSTPNPFEIVRLRAELEKWKTNHTEECSKLAKHALASRALASAQRIEELELRLSSVLNLVDDHAARGHISNYDALKERLDAATQEGGS